MQAKAESFFHYTRSFESLTQILSSKFFWPRYCLEDFTWLREGTPFWAFPMCSFCDIPFSRVESHTNVYGRYGIGLHRSWGINVGLNPVLYVNENSVLSEHLNKVLSLGKNKDVDGNLLDIEAFDAALGIFSFIKPTTGRTLRANRLVAVDFHLECEWRWVPCHFSHQSFYEEQFIVSPEEFNDQNFLTAAHAVTREFGLIFSPGDIAYMVVNTNQEVAALVDFIENTFAAVLSPQNLKVLFTKITSLEMLSDV
ncbi:MAG: hypothetical protein JWR15_3194 [Prosthecobacter sp.]|nr:hypothetical protein [Prosthecobacter sp.]